MQPFRFASLLSLLLLGLLLMAVQAGGLCEEPAVLEISQDTVLAWNMP